MEGWAKPLLPGNTLNFKDQGLEALLILVVKNSDDGKQESLLSKIH
jgi:hypothetical protein